MAGSIIRAMYIQDNGAPRRHVYTVSELNREARGVLEDGFGQVWVSGEISNFKAHMSGHCYFSLKDSGAQLD
ncbi:MAG: exodeoxyribonuclease VII large subunit, partial [Myxococcota bacterium]